MEKNKHVKPFFSTATVRLHDRITYLINGSYFLMDEK